MCAKRIKYKSWSDSSCNESRKIYTYCKVYKLGRKQNAMNESNRIIQPGNIYIQSYRNKYELMIDPKKVVINA